MVFMLQSQILAAAHRWCWIRKKSILKQGYFRDAYGTSIRTYMKLFYG
jgi:hypothetical protein